MFAKAQRHVLLLKFVIIPFCNGVALKIALPQGGILLFGRGKSRFGGQFDIPDQSP
jgi:hypothetical protein